MRLTVGGVNYGTLGTVVTLETPLTPVDALTAGDDDLTCSERRPPAWLSLWRSCFSREYLWTLDPSPRSRPSRQS